MDCLSSSANRKNRNVPEIRIVPMTPDLIAPVAQIERDSFSNPWSPKQFLEEIGRRDTVWALVALGPEVEGYCVAAHASDQMDLVKIAVRKDIRRKGIGRSLIMGLFQSAARSGCKKAFLEVESTNKAAIAFYKSMGFREIDVRKRYYTNTGQDAIIMLKALC